VAKSSFDSRSRTSRYEPSTCAERLYTNQSRVRVARPSAERLKTRYETPAVGSPESRNNLSHVPVCGILSMLYACSADFQDKVGSERRIMARRRGSASGGALLLVPIALIGLVLGNTGKSPAPPLQTSGAPPTTYASLPAEPATPTSPRSTAKLEDTTGPEPVVEPRRTAEPEKRTGPTAYISGHKVPLQAQPKVRGEILDRLGPKQAVTVLERRADWVEIRHNLTQREGWVQAKRLRDTEPEEEVAKSPSVSAALSVAAIAKLLIAASIADYPGPCACPYQSARNGSSCGRRAAYSRPGGYAPLCYARDVTPAMVAEYRATH